VWPDAVSSTAHRSLTSAYIPHLVRYSNVCAVRDEEVAGSNPATPTQVTGTITIFIALPALVIILVGVL